MAQQEIITAAAARVLVNDKVVGFLTAIAMTRDQGVKTIYEIDSPFARELAVGSGPYIVTGSIAGFRIRSTSGPDGFGIINASTVNDFFNQKYCKIEVMDRKTGRTIYTVDKVLFGTDTWRTSIKGVMEFTANFTGIFVRTDASA